MDRTAREAAYHRRVFFVRSIGHCDPTAARRITFEDSLRFERIHEEAYLSFGYELVDIPPGTIAARASRILAHLPTTNAATLCGS